MVFVLVSRIIQNLVGYLWPAYLCYKSIEARQPEGIRDWCVYWFMLSLFSIVERVLDAFLFWVPMYYPTKVAFVIYLWHPRTLGAKMLYGKTVRPVLNAHEAQIDAAIEEARVWLTVNLLSSKNKVVNYVQTAARELAAQAHKVTSQVSSKTNGIIKSD